MPIEIAKVPEAAIEAAAHARQSLEGRSVFREIAVDAMATDALHIAFPHRVAHLPLNRIRPQADLRSAAVMSGWRFLLQKGRAKDRTHAQGPAGEAAFASASAAVVATNRRGAFELSEVNSGPFVEASEEAIRLAEALPEVREGHYEAIYLSAPAVLVVAVWLKDQRGDADIVMPLQPTAPPLIANKPISPKDFLSALSRLAERVRHGS